MSARPLDGITVIHAAGEHAEPILRELGFDTSRRADMRAQGAI